MIGMRNVLAHAYDMVDLDAVWRTVHDDMPSARRSVERALASLPPEEAPGTSPQR